MHQFHLSQQNGIRAEQEFEKILQVKKYPYFHANSYQDRMEHWDYCFKRSGTTYKINVKGMRGMNRPNSYVDNTLIWVEFKNVGGNRGWLYGDSDLLAFEYFGRFLIVKTSDLRTLSEELVDLNSIAKNKDQALYRSYQRRDRKDQVSLIKIEDILSLKHKVWSFIPSQQENLSSLK